MCLIPLISPKTDDNFFIFIGLAHALISVKSRRIRNGDSPKNNQTKANTLVASHRYLRRIRPYFGSSFVCYV